MDKIKILLVEDQPFFRELLEKSIEATPELQLVGSTAAAETAVDLARNTSPDAVIMDIELEGDINGIEAGLKIKEHRLISCS